MTTKEHAYAVKKLIQPRISDDSQISIPFVVHLLKVARSFLLEQRHSKYKNISDFSYQTLKLDVLDSVCSPFQCVRTTTTLPSLLHSRRGVALRVFDEVMTEIPKTSFSRNRYRKESAPSYYLLNNRINIVAAPDLKSVVLVGIFDEIVNTCGLSPLDICDPLNIEFPMEQDLINSMYDIVVEKLFISYKAPQDTTNNSVDDARSTKS